MYGQDHVFLGLTTRDRSKKDPSDGLRFDFFYSISGEDPLPYVSLFLALGSPLVLIRGYIRNGFLN